ncbi:hypothetical protein [Mesorhizobium sp. LjNodule214]|uniref:hypothetical protein n=1 Tax=Mesorhizobium sp. LjNodule214 TaxID=3342252 RepID=UPI003ECEA8D3
MKVISIRPAPNGAGSAVAQVDIQFNDDIKFFGLRVSRRAGGGFSVFAPNGQGGAGRVVTFSPTLVKEISSAALAALQGPLLNEVH